MKLKARWGWFLGFTAVFAVLAAWVFWGTWSMGFAPVMPDCPITHSPYWFTGVWRGILTSGKFVPDDLKGFVASPYFWQELQYALALFFAALGMAYYCRGRGLSRLASYGAGILLAFCGYWCTLFSAGHLGWFRWMTYGVFAFGLADRAVRKGKLKNWLLLGACVAWGSFYQSDLWLLFTVFTGLYFVWCCVRERKLPWKGALLAVVVFLAVGAPAIRSAFVNDLAGRDKQIEDGQTVAGSDGMDEREKRWIFVTNWSMPPEDTLEFFNSRIHGDTSCPFTLSIGIMNGNGIKPYEGALGRPKDAPAGNYRQHSLYVGLITCLLALFGIAVAFFRLKASKPRNLGTSGSDLVFFLVAAIICWLCSMGRYCEPVYRVVFSLPFGDYLRAPVKWHHLTEFSLVVLAGFGIEALQSLLSRVSCLKAFALPIVGAVVMIGAVDLARVDHFYCAPVSVASARHLDSTMQMTVLQRGQFQDPQVADLVRRKHIVSIANYMGNPDYYLVGILDRCGQPEPMEKDSLDVFVLLLLGLSVVTTLGVVAYSAYAIKKR